MENPFKGRHFQADIILVCTCWYLRYALSYRDLEEMRVWFIPDGLADNTRV